MTRIPSVDSIWQDIRYAVRVLGRSPGFTTVAILSLALGIGANTAIFQLLDAVRLRSLPVPRADELATIHIVGGNGGMGLNPGRYFGATVTRPIWEELRRDHPAFSGVFAWDMPGASIGRGSERRRTEALRVSGELFPVLGVQPFRGRLLGPEDEVPCPSRTVVVSHGYWQRTMGGRDLRPDTTLLVDDVQMQVVGVTPPGFHGLSVGQSFEIAYPYCRPKTLRADVFYVIVMGRLAPGWTLDRASAQLHAASPAILEATPPTGYSADVVERYKRFRFAAHPAGNGVSQLRSNYDTSLWLLLAITGLVLLIACANLANLMLARASTRAREIALRLALGASRLRLLRQLTTESVLLAIAGSALGIGVSRVLSEALVGALSTDNDTITLAMTTDWRVLLFVTAVAALTCIVFGLVPALRATHASPVSAMKADGRGLTGSRERFAMQRLLVVTQIAVSLVLLVGALLFVRSFRNLMTFDAGVRQEGVLVTYFSMSSPSDRPPELHDAFQRQLLDHVRGVPGVLDAATTTSVPMTGNSWGHGITIGDKKGSSRFTWVSPEYFRTMGIRLVEGRNLEPSDTRSSRRVAVVNQAFVRRYFNGVNAIGRVMRTGAEPGYPATDYEIVGVVTDSRYNSLRSEFLPETFAPATQFPAIGSWATMVVHVNGPPEAAMTTIRRTLASAYPQAEMNLLVYQTQIRDGLVRERLMALLSGFFGALAAVLAMLGLYGVMSYLVARRRSEIGIRLALGARPDQVVRLVLREATHLVIAGLAIGTVLALVAVRSAGSLLFGLTPYDPVTLIGASLLLATIAAAASLLPARRASKLDPMHALRQE